MLYEFPTPELASWGSMAGTDQLALDLMRITAMTIEILYLTAQIHRWLNRSVARHLAAQAARLTR
jgi:hypothetical protein